VGMWVGLCLALIVIGIALLAVWNRVIKQMLVESAAAETVQTAPSK